MRASYHEQARALVASRLCAAYLSQAETWEARARYFAVEETKNLEERCWALAEYAMLYRRVIRMGAYAAAAGRPWGAPKPQLKNGLEPLNALRKLEDLLEKGWLHAFLEAYDELLK